MCIRDRNADLPIESIFRILNLRESLLVNILMGLLYKRQLMYRDIGVPNEEYSHSEIVKIAQVMEEQEKNLGFVPTKMPFQEQSELESKMDSFLKFPHDRNRGNDAKQLSLCPLLTAVISAFNMIEELFQSNANTRRGVSTNDADLKESSDMRQMRIDLEETKVKLITLEEKYQKILLKTDLPDNNQLVSLQDTVNDLRKTVHRQELEIDTLKSNTRGSEEMIGRLKEKLRELEENYEDLRHFYVPKLEEVSSLQRDIIDEMRSIKQDIQLFPGLLRTEDRIRLKVLDENAQLQGTIKKMADILGRERNKCKLFKDDLVRKERLIFELTDMIDKLQGEIAQQKNEIADKHSEIESLNKSISKLSETKATSDAKLKEMYELNELLDKKYRALEEQKIMLINRLKRFGDTSAEHYLQLK
eukprot:TRINITY_DN7362_c0_g1_i10.p1 TRINITY_DN7362_c0_g1~~TRINITY_DN7362_c0_g1_i10.p1  ORF type:complete len:435 (+),score=97.20 TRINITY_DN7362_c0_g1_i10:57-1307(+)